MRKTERREEEYTKEREGEMRKTDRREEKYAKVRETEFVLCVCLR